MNRDGIELGAGMGGVCDTSMFQQNNSGSLDDGFEDGSWQDKVANVGVDIFIAVGVNTRDVHALAPYYLNTGLN